MRLSFLLLLWGVFGSGVLGWGRFASAAVRVEQAENRVDAFVDSSPAISFWYGPGMNKPFVYPLLTAADVNLLRGWPMDPKPGDSHDHIHQRGVWFAHANVNGFDFWNTDPSYRNAKMGKIVVDRIVSASGGRHEGSIVAVLQWIDPSGKPILREDRTMVFHDGDPRLVDFDFDLTALTPVTFGDEKDGVFGLRRASELEEPSKSAPASSMRTGVIRGSTGCKAEAGCWGTRADWMDVSGQFPSGAAGITVFDHPSNPRFPTYWHVRGYGLLAANVFGVREFTKSPDAQDELLLAPGQHLRFRYRVVLHSGDASKPDLDGLFKKWTETR